MILSKKIHRLADLKDRIGFTIRAAPDQFPKLGSFGDSQEANLLIACEILDQGFPLLEKKIRDPLQLVKLRQVLRDALAA